MIIPYIMEHKKNVLNHQPDYKSIWILHGSHSAGHALFASHIRHVATPHVTSSGF